MTVSSVSSLFRRKAGGLVRQPVKGGKEQAADKEHEDTKGHLPCDQTMHQAPARMRILTTFQRAGRLNGRGAKRRKQPEQERHAEAESQSESQYAPIERKG